jgi:hypothetical protein
MCITRFKQLTNRRTFRDQVPKIGHLKQLIEEDIPIQKLFKGIYKYLEMHA